jgi:hypothetical protein
MADLAFDMRSTTFLPRARPSGGQETVAYSVDIPHNVVFARTSATIHTMDELAPQIRRSDRPMASLDAGRSSDGGRRGTRGFGALEPSDDGNLSLGRRIGVLVVLAALAGAIILAAGGVGGNNAVVPVASPTASPVSASRTAAPLVAAPTAAPEIEALGEDLINSRTIDLRVSVPEPGTTMAGLELRIYRNTRLLASREVTKVGRVRVKNVPLRRGANKLSATLANAGGEGPRSSNMTVNVDDQPPRVTVRTPRSGITINDDSVTVQGKTEDGLMVVGRNTTSDRRTTTVAGASGAFALPIRLDKGRNTITVQTRDAAGNRGATNLVIYRGNGRPTVSLELSRKKIRLEALPLSLNTTATVRDANGLPIEGARVTFTIAPPGLPTDVNEVTTGRDGEATWSRFRLLRKGATRGPVVVTARVVIPGGRPASRTAELEIR